MSVWGFFAVFFCRCIGTYENRNVIVLFCNFLIVLALHTLIGSWSHYTRINGMTSWVLLMNRPHNQISVVISLLMIVSMKIFSTSTLNTRSQNQGSCSGISSSSQPPQEFMFVHPSPLPPPVLIVGMIKNNLHVHMLWLITINTWEEWINLTNMRHLIIYCESIDVCAWKSGFIC